MLYIAKHTLVVGENTIVKKGQYVQSGTNIAEEEIPGLLQTGALELAAGAPDFVPETRASTSQEEIAEIFKPFTKEQMIELAAEQNFFDLSMEMTREQIIAKLVENNVAP
jgi:hypothetical protein